MNSGKNILIQVLFVMLILFCAGLETINHTFPEPASTEISPYQNNDDIQANADSDVFDDDHFNPEFEFTRFTDLLHILPVKARQSFYSEFSDTGWQPPQFS